MGGGDRGGIGELIKIIKKSKIPIVCICNDRFHPKLKSLVNHCVDLRFRKPSKAVVSKVLSKRLEVVGYNVPVNSIELMVGASSS